MRKGWRLFIVQILDLCWVMLPLPGSLCLVTQILIDMRKHSTRVILPDQEYEDRLEMLSLPILARFLLELSQRHFSKIASDSSHPLFSRIIFNNCRMSSRNNTLYRPQRCRTQKRAKSFFKFFISESNKWFTCIYIYMCFLLIFLFMYTFSIIAVVIENV